MKGGCGWWWFFCLAGWLFCFFFKEESVHHCLETPNRSLKITCDYWNPWAINNNYHPHYWAKDDRESGSASEHTEGKSNPQLLKLPRTHSSWQTLSYPECHCHFLLDCFLQLSNPELQQTHDSFPSSKQTDHKSKRSQPSCGFGFLLPFDGTGLWDKTYLSS